MAEPLLRVENLGAEVLGAMGSVRLIEDVSFELARGEKLALVGESGSGKTVTALSILKLLSDARYRGRVFFEGQDLIALSERAMRGIRGREIAMVFQEPMTAFNPLYTIGNQICEVLELHEGMRRAAARNRALEMLERVRVSDPQRCFSSLSHQLSGGQRQRAMIAMALACQPKLLIADEPTTALDVTIQRRIVALLDELQRDLGMAVLLITHDLPLVSNFADRIAVMKDGRIVEQGDTARVFTSPAHPYTRALIDSRPTREVSPPPLGAAPLLDARGIRCAFVSRRGWFGKSEFPAVRGVDLHLGRGETLAVVGESGSGKTTLGMALLSLSTARCEGDIVFDGMHVGQLGRDRMRSLRRRMQIVFQDPYNALSPRMTVGSIVAEGLREHLPELDAQERQQAVIAVLREVGMDEEAMDRYPHEFSGGQRQRIAIARAVVLRPDLIVLDEPTSALDVSVQRQVLRLLADLQRRYRLAYLFITHDLAVVRAMAHRVLVMKDGAVVERGALQDVFGSPREAYTQELLAASLDPAISGMSRQRVSPAPA